MSDAPDNRKWGWMIRGEGSGARVRAPFDTRQDAVADAQNAIDMGRPVGIGRVTWPAPRDCVPDGLEFLEEMQDYAAQLGFVGVSFSADVPKLGKALRKLVEEHVAAASWTLMEIEWQNEHVHRWTVVNAEGTSWELCANCGKTRRIA